MNTRSRRALAVVLLSSAFVSACGLKPEVRDQLAQGGGAGTTAGGVAADGTTTGGDALALDPLADPAAGGTDPALTGTDPAATGTDPAATGGDPAATGGDPAATGGDPAATGGTAPTSGGAAAPAPGSAPAPGGGNTTGIDLQRKVINIAVHGPLTGAGVPQESFRTGTPKYWKGRKLANGFTVNAEAIDDKYTAQDAARVCAEAAGKYFLILGGAGTDQIQACAQQQKVRAGGVPYLSAGVTEVGLGNLPNYFGTSLTYKQQGPLVVKMAQEQGFFSGKWAVVATEGPNFQDAVDSITGALVAAKAQGKAGAFNPGTNQDVYRTAKAPRDCAALAGQLRGGGYTAIYFLGQPAFFIQCVGAVGAGPTYTGVGPSFGINTVANLACANTAGQYKGVYLHPATGLDQAARRAPGVQFADDIEYQIYGAMQGVEAALNAVKGPLSREAFIKTLAAGSIPAGIAPGASFNGGSRFGGTSAFALKADCGKRQYVTLKEYGK